MRLLFICLLLFSGKNIYADNLVKIGVLNHRGHEAALETWNPMANYLSESIKGHDFKIMPLDFNEIDNTIKNNTVDFLLVNPGIYVVMEVRHRVSRIATLKKLVSGSTYNKFGGVIFTLNDRNDINQLSDIRNKSFMAVDEISLGGFQMAWRELQMANIDPYKDLKELRFGGLHDDVVRAIKKRKVDVGTVRSGILESMTNSGEIKLDDFKIINQKKHNLFPALHSTELYPEWPFSKLKNTPNALAKSVAIALLKMEEKTIEKESNLYKGWTIPLEYQPVHDLLHALQLPPYEKLTEFTLLDAIKKYWFWIIITAAVISVIILMMIWVQHLNHALKKSKRLLETQYSLILDSVADGIYGLDLEGNSTFVNKSMEKITGWKAEYVVGKNQHSILHHTKKDGSPHHHSECPAYKTFEDNKPRFVKDDIFWKSDGTSIPVEYTSTPLKDENSKTIGSVVVFRDISEKKKAEAQLQKFRDKLANVARLNNIGEMASGMAHELNQPLTAILTNSDACIRLLQTTNINTELLMDTLEKIGAQSKLASGIIHQLRQFVKKETPQLLLIDINESIISILALIQYDLENENIQIDLKLSNNLPKVYAQPIQIDQVLLNLIRNGIDSMNNEKNKQIIIKSEIEKDFVKVTLSDTGSGIDDNILNQLFTPYKTTKPQGIGLGLSISEGIILAHNGSIMGYNNPQKGASFYFTLPLEHNNG